ncbi:hypothetical protein CCHL11_00966 [Colletotrichum chlorophyti]|uniref:Clr5 domain-containing protein n=1 Tax=Colletotrichum chlorophyti TaxID=708187 RepID=A0A1Q8S7J2_9PEZI|nr:hypothetical protein CCHL11_00966 [Colletotrichum chlorophyti]
MEFDLMTAPVMELSLFNSENDFWDMSTSLDFLAGSADFLLPSGTPGGFNMDLPFRPATPAPATAPPLLPPGPAATPHSAPAPAPVKTTTLAAPLLTAHARAALQRPKGPDDWEAKKTMIKHFYLDENLPLREIVAIMANEHGFSATYVSASTLLLCAQADGVHSQRKNAQAPFRQVELEEIRHGSFSAKSPGWRAGRDVSRNDQMQKTDSTPTRQ